MSVEMSVKCAGMLWALLLSIASARVTTGRFDADNTQWEFIDKFCFDESGGTVTFSYDVESRNPQGQQLLFYSDMTSSFPAIYATDNSCGFKRNVSNQNVRLYTNVSLGPTGRSYDVKGARPRWWYLVFSNCDGPEERIGLTYTVTYLNSGGKYSRHFSSDEQGIFEALIFAIVILTGLIVLYAVTFYKFRKQKNRSHYLHAVMLVVVSVKWLSTIIRLADRDTYASDGIGHPTYESVALFFDMVPDIILTTLLIFISKGWAISAHRVQDGAIRAVLETLLVYTVASIVCYAWTFQEFDPVLHQSIYQTDPGIILMILRMMLLVWFISNLHLTWRDERNITRKRFYVAIFLYGLVYYLYLPVTLIMATRLDSWMQKKAVVVTDILILLFEYTAMWVLFGFCGRYRGRAPDDDDDAPTLGGKRSSEDIPFEDIPKLSPAVVGSGAHAEDSDNNNNHRRKSTEEHEGDEGEEEEY